MQQSRNNKFDQQVKNTLENASVEPPAFLWNAIESKLPPSKTWYSKYKYLLLLLLLVFTSASSIYVYKNIFLKNSGSQIALNKRLLKDEIGQNSDAENSGNKLNSASEIDKSNVAGTKTDLTSPENKSDLNNSKPSVSSFYSTDKNVAKNEGALYAEQKTAADVKRAARLKRLEVQPENQEAGTMSQDLVTALVPQKNTTTTTSSSSSSAMLVKEKGTRKATKNRSSGNSKSTESSLQDAAIGLSENKNSNTSTANNYNTGGNAADAADGLVIADNSAEKQISAEVEQDITQPISEPIRGTAAEQLTASVVPVKVQQSPISGRDVLRSMIEPEKLEKLDIESQAAGITDLNPNKEKFLKNLKQFAGYDINKGFHIGAFISINNVWLNKKTFSADENTTSITPKVQFGKAYGLNIGYDYTDRWGIELEAQISEQGQKYNMRQLTEDHDCIKDVNLLYLKFPLMMKYKQTFINNYNSKPIALSFLFGPQIGFLLKKNVMMDGNELKNTPEYNKTEFGIAGGFDFDLFMTRNLALTIGGRTGFASSFKKGQPMSFQLGVTTQLNFRFPKKIK